MYTLRSASQISGKSPLRKARRNGEDSHSQSADPDNMSLTKTKSTFGTKEIAPSRKPQYRRVHNFSNNEPEAQIDSKCTTDGIFGPKCSLEGGQKVALPVFF
jgi:hypothetical protein